MKKGDHVSLCFADDCRIYRRYSRGGELVWKLEVPYYKGHDCTLIYPETWARQKISRDDAALHLFNEILASEGERKYDFQPIPQEFVA